jgi:ATP phosphoribosyltransferase
VSALLNIALPKGRLGDDVHRLFSLAGFARGDLSDMGRKLVLENEEAGVRYFLVKPGDVAIYVEHGAADLGIVGKDVLEEDRADVYELLDLNLGKCRMCVAGPKDFKDDGSKVLRVATKFVNIAERYYASLGREVDIIKLGGSIELAPLLGLSDVIVDIVESGKTLRENNLVVLSEIMPISARLIANKVAYQFQSGAIDNLRERLIGVMK